MNKKVLLLTAVFCICFSVCADSIDFYTLRNLEGYTFVQVDTLQKIWKNENPSTTERIFVLEKGGKFLVSDYQMDPLVSYGTKVAVFVKREITSPGIRMMIIDQGGALSQYAEVALVIQNKIYKTFWKIRKPVPPPTNPMQKRKPGKIR